MTDVEIGAQCLFERDGGPGRWRVSFGGRSVCRIVETPVGPPYVLVAEGSDEALPLGSAEEIHVEVVRLVRAHHLPNRG